VKTKLYVSIAIAVEELYVYCYASLIFYLVEVWHLAGKFISCTFLSWLLLKLVAYIIRVSE
jgi:hypothetical protein